MRRLHQEDFEETARNFGLRVAEIRRTRGLTQQELATNILSTIRWVARVEAGKQNLTMGTMVRLSQALGVRIADFFAAPKTEDKKAMRGRPRKSRTPPNTGGDV